MSSLETIIKAVQSSVRTVPGLEAVPDYVPEQMNTTTMLLAYAGSGSWRWGTVANANGYRAYWAVHKITVRLHVFRNTLPASHEKIMPFSQSVPEALFRAYQTDKFGGTVTVMGDAANPGAVDPITYSFAPDEVGGQPTLSWTFIMTVSTEEELPT